MKHRKEKSHKEWVEIRNSSPVDSEQYKRASDNIRDIQGDVNNNQVGDLTDFIKEYKLETDKTIKSNHILTLVLLAFAVIQVIIALMQFILEASSFKWFGLSITIVLVSIIIYVTRSFDKIIDNKEH